MSDAVYTNDQLFHDAVSKVQLSEKAHIAMLYWRDTPNTVKVSIVDIDNLGDVIDEFEGKLKAEVSAVPELQHVTVEVATREQTNEMGNRNYSNLGNGMAKVCAYLHGNVAMDTLAGVF